MSKFVTEDGIPCDADSANRAIWYGMCAYWTDDWEKLVTSFSGIPCCPGCQSPGFITTAKKWLTGATEHESKGHYQYRAFINSLKDKCHGRGADFNELYEQYKLEHNPRAG